MVSPRSTLALRTLLFATDRLRNKGVVPDGKARADELDGLVRAGLATKGGWGWIYPEGRIVGGQVYSVTEAGRKQVYGECDACGCEPWTADPSECWKCLRPTGKQG